MKDLFTKVLIGATEHGTHSDEEEDKDSLNHGGLKDIEIQKIKNSRSAAYFKVDEQMKRMNQMAKNMGNDAMFPVKKTLVINPQSPIIQNALKLHELGKEALVQKICHHVEDLAHISSEGLKHEDREAFVKRTQELMQELTNLAL